MSNKAFIPSGDYAPYPIYHAGKTTTINSRGGGGMLARPQIQGVTRITKPNPNADVSPDNIATITGVENPVFTVSGESKTLSETLYMLPNGVADRYDGAVRTRRISKIVLSGTEDFWLYTTSGSNNMFVSNVIDDFSISASALVCTHFKHARNAPYSIHIGGGAGKVELFMPKDLYPDAQSVLTYFANQKAAGTPVTLYYEAVNPIKTYANCDLTLNPGTNTLSCNNDVLHTVTWLQIDARRVPLADDSRTLGGVDRDGFFSYAGFYPSGNIYNIADSITFGSFVCGGSRDVAGLPTIPGYVGGAFWQGQVFTNTTNNIRLKTMIVYPYNDGFDRYFIAKKVGKWSPWLEVATAEKSRLTLLNGWEATAGYPPFVSKSGNIATINLLIRGGVKDDGTVLAHVPEAYRPSFRQRLFCFSGDSYNGTGGSSVDIFPGGEIAINFLTKNIINLSATYTI